LATITIGAEPTWVMEVKSRSTSNGSLPSAGLLACEENAMSSVYPSGALLATSSAPMFPEAPGRLSTTTAWPQRSPSFWATRRAMMSVPPPGANPTTTRTGRDGNVV